MLLAVQVAGDSIVRIALGATAWPGGGRAPLGPWSQLAPRDLSETFLHAGEKDFRDFDKKDVVPPGKYCGDAGAWRH